MISFGPVNSNFISTTAGYSLLTLNLISIFIFLKLYLVSFLL